MNKYAYLLREIFECNTITQRELAQKMSLSLGSVNTLIKEAISLNYITKSDNKAVLTLSGLDYLSAFKVDRAIIMAAGFGSRFVPLTFETPKGLLEVFQQCSMLLRIHHHVVHVNVGVSAELLEEALLHATLKGGAGVS